MKGAEDTYLTIASDTEVSLRERSSKFLAFAYPVETEEQVKARLDALHKKYFDATHHCYAWRLGPAGDKYRANDDGEPSGTAGRPILGQLLSYRVTNVMVVVVRYFGGTKLGVPGLISAYRDSARTVLDECEIIEKIVMSTFRLRYPYQATNGIMKAVKDIGAEVVAQGYDTMCIMDIAVREGRCEEFLARLSKCEGVMTERL